MKFLLLPCLLFVTSAAFARGLECSFYGSIVERLPATGSETSVDIHTEKISVKKNQSKKIQYSPLDIDGEIINDKDTYTISISNASKTLTQSKTLDIKSGNFVSLDLEVPGIQNPNKFLRFSVICNGR